MGRETMSENLSSDNPWSKQEDPLGERPEEIIGKREQLPSKPKSLKKRVFSKKSTSGNSEFLGREDPEGHRESKIYGYEENEGKSRLKSVLAQKVYDPKKETYYFPAEVSYSGYQGNFLNKKEGDMTGALRVIETQKLISKEEKKEIGPNNSPLEESEAVIGKDGGRQLKTILTKEAYNPETGNLELGSDSVHREEPVGKFGKEVSRIKVIENIRKSTSEEEQGTKD